MIGVHRKSDGRYESFGNFYFFNDTNKKKIDVRHLIILCELGEEYKSFCEDLEELIQDKKRKNVVEDVYRVIMGEFSFHANKYKPFINKHKKALKLMNKYKCTSNLTTLSYDIKGHRKTYLNEDFFYNYLMENKESIEIIKNVALRLYSLGFSEICYDKTFDFANYIFNYDLHTFSLDIAFAYMDNLEVYPSYERDSVKYGTTWSPYCMVLKQGRSKGERKILDFSCDKEIYVNTLIFDYKILPEELTTVETSSKIVELANENSNEYSMIRDSVNFGVKLDDLYKEYNELKKIVDGIDSIREKEKLISLMQQLNSTIESIQGMEEAFEVQNLYSSNYLTPELLDSEKKAYVRRRESSYYDYD